MTKSGIHWKIVLFFLVTLLIFSSCKDEESDQSTGSTTATPLYKTMIGSVATDLIDSSPILTSSQIGYFKYSAELQVENNKANTSQNEVEIAPHIIAGLLKALGDYDDSELVQPSYSFYTDINFSTVDISNSTYKNKINIISNENKSLVKLLDAADVTEDTKTIFGNEYGSLIAHLDDAKILTSELPTAIRYITGQTISYFAELKYDDKKTSDAVVGMVSKTSANLGTSGTGLDDTTVISTISTMVDSSLTDLKAIGLADQTILDTSVELTKEIIDNIGFSSDASADLLKATAFGDIIKASLSGLKKCELDDDSIATTAKSLVDAGVTQLIQVYKLNDITSDSAVLNKLAPISEKTFAGLRNSGLSEDTINEIAASLIANTINNPRLTDASFDAEMPAAVQNSVKSIFTGMKKAGMPNTVIAKTAEVVAKEVASSLDFKGTVTADSSTDALNTYAKDTMAAAINGMKNGGVSSEEIAKNIGTISESVSKMAVETLIRSKSTHLIDGTMSATELQTELKKITMSVISGISSSADSTADAAGGIDEVVTGGIEGIKSALGSIEFETDTPASLSTTNINGAVDKMIEGSQEQLVAMNASDSVSSETGKNVASSASDSQSSLTDTDAPEVEITTDSITTTESGDDGMVKIKMSAKPSKDIIVKAKSSNTKEGTISPSSLTFTPENWSNLQTFNISPVDDGKVEDAMNYSISITANTGFRGTVGAKNNDNDQIGIETAKRGSLFVGGGKFYYGIKLRSQPSSDVTISWMISVGSMLKIDSGRSMTFTSANWNTSQTTTISVSNKQKEMDETISGQLQNSTFVTTDSNYTEWIEEQEENSDGIVTTFKIYYQNVYIKSITGSGNELTATLHNASDPEFINFFYYRGDEERKFPDLTSADDKGVYNKALKGEWLKYGTVVFTYENGTFDGLTAKFKAAEGQSGSGSLTEKSEGLFFGYDKPSPEMNNDTPPKYNSLVEKTLVHTDYSI